MNLKPLFFLFFLITSNFSFCQLDSVSISHSYSTITSSYDSTVTEDVLNISIWFNDTLDVGSIEIIVTDTINQSPLAYEFVDSSFIHSAGRIDMSSNIKIPLNGLNQSSHYLIKVYVRNAGLFILPEEILELPGI